MPDQHRDIETLLVDYADALRDGCIPIFLKSLSRTEATTLSRSSEFLEATEMVRALNEIHFADRAVKPEVGLFISRVDAKIASRLKQPRPIPLKNTSRAHT